MENTKKCSKCGRELPLSEFSKDKSKSDGLCSWCKECAAQYRVNNREAILEHKRQFYQTLEGFCTVKYNSHLTKDINRGFFTRETIPPNYITAETLIELYQQPDFYDNKLYNWSLMSADRIDDDKPHTIDNVIPTTWKHNNDRHYKRMSVEEYREHIQKEGLTSPS